ncbi:MAG: SAM-dependent methyltransferase [Clostridia bacterium]|nr:SAM-dependent methyltransferase [Clostridia bacterium]
MTNYPKLSPRLTALCEAVRPGARLLDVGSDHAYLPVYAVLAGRASAALASDIAAGPVARAKEHIAAYGADRAVKTMQTPGLTGTEDFGATDIVIAGMGGEMIASILAQCAYIRDSRILLILQPMTKAAALRAFLAENGFDVSREMLIEEDRRIYEAFTANYTGRPYPLTPAEAEVGRLSGHAGLPLLERQVKKKIARYEKALRGKREGARDCRGEEELLAALKDLRETLQGKG